MKLHCVCTIYVEGGGEHNPIHVYSEVGSTGFSGSYRKNEYFSPKIESLQMMMIYIYFDTIFQ